MKRQAQAFTLVELMIVITVIAFISMMALPSYHRFLAKSKRSEAMIHLSALCTAEKLYFAEHGTYTDKLTGPESLGWKAEGLPHYTYGFAGKEGVNFLKGKLQATSLPAEATVLPTGFIIAAIADIDGDGVLDIITIDQNRMVKIVQDDLA
jgi:prepilin-type N-terminal cleavage/methylation domain-containing protein